MLTDLSNNKNLYYIGGIVRDEILNIPCFDTDITYEGNAIEFCKQLVNQNDKIYKIIQINEDFGTVKLKINNQNIDIASTRDEYYPLKGHLPIVKNIGCELKKDVLRRDFTINAIAKSLENGKIIDYTQGLNDIKLKQLRVLHDNSFIDDPSRILRGLKFSVRLGFELEPHTKKLQEYYLNNVNYDMSYKRLKKELTETFNLNKQEAYEKFFKQKIYKLISNEEPKYYKYNIEELINKYPIKNTWLVYLGYLNLDNLPLTKIEKKIVEDYKFLKSQNEPKTDYETYKLFEKCETESILLYTITNSSSQGLRYFEIKHIKPELTGKDLIQQGYTPSTKFEQCFDYILKHKLKNTQINKKDEIELAKDFFKNQY